MPRIGLRGDLMKDEMIHLLAMNRAAAAGTCANEFGKNPRKRLALKGLVRRNSALGASSSERANRAVARL